MFLKFLFQIGSIKSPKTLLVLLCLCIGFYSKLVRLKAGVRLPHVSASQGFYSKLVRLKGSRDTRRDGIRALFLFQIGSIKSEEMSVEEVIRVIVSIPNWFD